MTKITRLTLAPDTCGVHNVTIDINSKNKSQKDRIRDLWLNDGIMERLDFKNDGARLHEGGSNGSSVRHVKQVIREVSVYIQRDKELQQASDAQFLVQVLLVLLTLSAFMQGQPNCSGRITLFESFP